MVSAHASLHRFALPGLRASASVSRRLFPERMVAAPPVVGNPPASQALERAQEMEPRATGSRRAGPWALGQRRLRCICFPSLPFPSLWLPPASLRTAWDTPRQLLPFLLQSIALVVLTWPPGGLWCSVPGTQGPPLVRPCCLEVEGQELRQDAVPGQPRMEALSGPRQTPASLGGQLGACGLRAPFLRQLWPCAPAPMGSGRMCFPPVVLGAAGSRLGLQSEPLGLERWGCEVLCGLPVGRGWSPAHPRAGASPAACLSSVRIWNENDATSQVCAVCLKAVGPAWPVTFSNCSPWSLNAEIGRAHV